ncbi:MAG: formylmethanofuran dehydrogenase [Methylophilus sp.]|nr:formylmethanofuran dehydrogenase [Methylophilus sp.]
MQISNPIKSTHVTCPACGLLCDDISAAKLASGELEITQSDAHRCEKLLKFFKRPSQRSAEVNGKQVSIAEAIAHAAQLIKQHQSPIFSGLSTDLSGFRAAYQLAQRSRAAMVHMNAKSSARNTKVLQSTGWQTTTLTEVKNRADVIVCIGTDVVSHNARFFERAVWTKEAMFTDPSARQIVYLGGENLDTAQGVSPNGVPPKVLACAPQNLPEVTAALRALIQDKPLKADRVGGIALAELAAVVEQLKSAKYAVLVWIAKDLDFPHAELTIQNITESVVALNHHSRAMGLSLGGSDGDTTVNYAHTWLDGLTLTERDENQHDLVVWVNSFSPDKTMPAYAQPVIAIGHPDTVFASPPAVFIPVATPGLDSAGTLFRVDSSVVLPLKPVYESALPTLAEVLAQMEAQLA